MQQSGFHSIEPAPVPTGYSSHSAYLVRRIRDGVDAQRGRATIDIRADLAWALAELVEATCPPPPRPGGIHRMGQNDLGHLLQRDREGQR